jgi:hypothetical protein
MTDQEVNIEETEQPKIIVRCEPSYVAHMGRPDGPMENRVWIPNKSGD